MMGQPLVREDELKHYGVLGMKWGRRKRSVTTNSSSSTKRTPSSGQRRMSNKELASRVKRLKLESEYAKLTAQPPKNSRVKTLVKTAGTVAALSGSALTIYKNLNEAAKLASK